ncbi:hypothetical protein AB0J83_44005 [Actinoplanes sp. NPDC049596]|uniref:hypothetical protein n=1 Tax=unclassified Actinoplanes TaxID=2626549 RepID=UPI00341EB0EF
MSDVADKTVHERWVEALTRAGVPLDKVAEALKDVTEQEAAALKKDVERLVS